MHTSKERKKQLGTTLKNLRESQSASHTHGSYCIITCFNFKSHTLLYGIDRLSGPHVLGIPHKELSFL